jgi:hypothetical protein
MLTNVSSKSRQEQGDVEVWQSAIKDLMSVMDRMTGMCLVPLV